MNNSLLSIEVSEQEENPTLRAREAELVKIIDAIKGIVGTAEWSTLKLLVFDGEVERYEKQVSLAAKSATIDTSHLYRLQGQLVHSRRFSKLEELADAFRLELINVRKLNPPTERDIAPDTL